MDKNQPSTSHDDQLQIVDEQEAEQIEQLGETEEIVVEEIVEEQLEEAEPERKPLAGAPSVHPIGKSKFGNPNTINYKTKRVVFQGHTDPSLTLKRRRVAGSIIGAGISPNQSNLTEVARRSGRPTVVHSSGVEFPIPLSLESHPIALSDVIPEAAHDILKDDDGMPYCSSCHSVLKTWRAFEYHVLSKHLKYKPHRCLYCMKEYFYTEEEGVSHVKSLHAGKPVTLLKEYDADKEKEAEEYFKHLFLMVREGGNLTRERMDKIEEAAYNHLQKYRRMRFKVPTIVCRQGVLRDTSTQTYMSMATSSESYLSSAHSHVKYQPLRMPSSNYQNRNAFYAAREEQIQNEMVLEPELAEDGQPQGSF